MSDKIITDYLQKNKDKFSQEQLKQELLRRGHSILDINTAIKQVYSVSSIRQSLGQLVKKPSQQTKNQQFFKRPVDKKKLFFVSSMVILIIGAIGLLLGSGSLLWGNINQNSPEGEEMVKSSDSKVPADSMFEVEEALIDEGTYDIGKTVKTNKLGGQYSMTLKSIEANELNLKINLEFTFVPTGSISTGFIRGPYGAEFKDSEDRTIPEYKDSKGKNYGGDLISTSFKKDDNKKSGWIVYAQPSYKADSYSFYYPEFPLVEGIIFEKREANNEDRVVVKKEKGAIDTIITIDSSGSMDEDATLADKSSVTKSKREAAKRASAIINTLIAKESTISGIENRIGAVAFDGVATKIHNISSDYNSVNEAISKAYGLFGTNIGGGLKSSLELLEKSEASNRVIILLSDGMSNTGLSSEEIISGPAEEAKEKSIVIYTIGFGSSDPKSEGIDAALLYLIAKNTGGKYYYAESVTELASAFTNLYHTTSGEIVKSVDGTIRQDEVKYTKFKIESGADFLKATLNWPGSQLEMTLIDPNGRRVKISDRVDILQESDFENIIYRNPMPGEWMIEIEGTDVPDGETDFYLIASTQEKDSGISLISLLDWVQDRASYILIIVALLSLMLGGLLFYKYKKAN